ncbi:unnamed protein product [Larinioides sclopetarius]|uniref:Uncharacterized protein n=1 Tax=Larinioides sclopetarius TaxID=280406 RepID=A0AAV1ZA61_9ARAC
MCTKEVLCTSENCTLSKQFDEVTRNAVKRIRCTNETCPVNSNQYPVKALRQIFSSLTCHARRLWSTETMCLRFYSSSVVAELEFATYVNHHSLAFLRVVRWANAHHYEDQNKSS